MPQDKILFQHAATEYIPERKTLLLLPRFLMLSVFFIGNRYTCMQKLREIDRLQQQLRDVRFEALSISSELTGNSRQSQIELLIEEQGIDLEGAKTPPYELYK